MKKNRILVLAVGVILILSLLGACSQQDGGISVSDVWARPGISEGNSAIFFVIDNPGATDDKLISASSDIAAAVELHKSSMVDGTMKMEMQKFIPVPAGEKVIFKPGDFHVMLIELHDDMAVGDHFEVVLEFESTGKVFLDVVVREP